ncbi:MULTISPECIES: DUF1269 domain-containing protein [Streptomyces]|uniref:Membrane protein n=1 Tax=Streptomyces clavifer TaxID=68188 RepID=A0ABS4VH04_9ACTN|nr:MULTISPECIES: DUF1269 domain-containing protein [Streptomyces]KQX91558.1 hypothetical protein ASD26_23760 [Streptomyces sp. Root1319]KQZ20119.1 hypothetical protein ASD51_25290 [Streptomyces sp. Root55]MBP2363179.1 putative membrane protein [Streptomyces clavifer]MDX2743144.1 DUF1269 domain-containing protein [Streptomyces sp. NRRL_B-2557]MDX3061184.1 DUF1269 domain-containing protein [Streptomyces sp. ND04-05B]
MSTLTVWKFHSADGAEKVETSLKSLQKEGLIKILDAAVVSWPAERSKPKTKQLVNLVGAGALSGTFWGMLFGLIFLMPLLGAAIGAAAGALGGKLADVGIDDDFIAEVKEKVTPGTSALFLMTMDEVPSRISESLPGGGAELLHSNLDTGREAKLRDIFGDDAE